MYVCNTQPQIFVSTILLLRSAAMKRKLVSKFIATWSVVP